MGDHSSRHYAVRIAAEVCGALVFQVKSVNGHNNLFCAQYRANKMNFSFPAGLSFVFYGIKTQNLEQKIIKVPFGVVHCGRAKETLVEYKIVLKSVHFLKLN